MFILFSYVPCTGGKEACWRLEAGGVAAGKGTGVGLWDVVSLLSPTSGVAAMQSGGVAGSVEDVALLLLLLAGPVCDGCWSA